MSEDAPVVVTLPKADAPAVADLASLEMIALDELVIRVQALALAGARFVTATCLDTGDGFEVLYHFDRNLEMSHLGVRVDKGRTLPSISGVYLCAFLVENEIEDLFGLRVEGMPLDYRHHLVLATGSTPAPLLKDRGRT